VTLECPLAPVVALLPGLPVFDSRLFARSANLIRVRAEDGAVKKLYIGIFRFPLRKINSTSGSLRSV